MARVVLVHWNESECRQRVAELSAAGHAVVGHWSAEQHAPLDPPPDLLVISLDRLPSHGRAVAGGFWGAKKRQSIPIVFVGGEKEKAEVARREFKAARFCAATDLPALIERIGSLKPVVENRKPRTRSRRPS